MQQAVRVILAQPVILVVVVAEGVPIEPALFVAVQRLTRAGPGVVAAAVRLAVMRALFHHQTQSQMQGLLAVQVIQVLLEIQVLRALLQLCLV